MSFTFIRPVYFGDTVTCTIMITDVDAKNRARAVAEFVNQDGIKVMEGHLTGFLPGEKEKSVLRRMVEEGDGTNKLRGAVKPGPGPWV
jgi:3-hydroxybutyryl-CoA dehydratase